MSSQFSGKGYFSIPKPLRRKGHLNLAVITVDQVLTERSAQYQVLDSEAAPLNVDLPVLKDGLIYIICNAGATTNLSVRDADGSPVETLTPSLKKTFLCNGTLWIGI